METWVYFTILAAFMQAVRTAGQKHLSKSLSAISTTLVRFLFALPFVWVYLFLITHLKQSEIPQLNSNFLESAILAAIAQIVGTAFVIKAFQFQNFAVATSLVKTEAVLTAVLGVLVFDAVLSGLGWLSFYLQKPCICLWYRCWFFFCFGYPLDKTGKPSFKYRSDD